MKKEAEIAQNIVDYLIQLGYPRNSISSQYRIGTNQIADFVVSSSGLNGPWLVVESKAKLDLADREDILRLQFDPTVRQLQRNATALGAKYYMLSDGQSWLFFETDETGRPRLLDEPVRAPSQIVSTKTGPPSRETIVDVFRQLSQFLLIRKNWSASDPRIAAVLLAHFSAIQGESELKRILLETDIFSEDSVRQLERLGLTRNDFISEPRLDEAFRILEQIRLDDADKRNILVALDQVFLDRMQKYFGVSRWLADFMVRLAHLHADSVMLDLDSTAGNIPVAASLHQERLETWGVVRNPVISVWANLQLAIIGHRPGTIVVSDDYLGDSRLINSIPAPTHIITAPRMGGRMDDRAFRHDPDRSFLYLQGVRHPEDILLEMAISKVQRNGIVVILVPDGMLFGGGTRKQTRDFLTKNVTLLAVIGLESGALKPFSSIMASILVMRKVTPSDDHQVYMTRIEGLDSVPSEFDSSLIPQVSLVLDSFEEWTRNHSILPMHSVWKVKQLELDERDLSVTRYRPPDQPIDNLEEKFSRFVTIGTVSKVMRGRRIKLDESGPISVIGPATIRPMRMDVGGVGKTLQDNIPDRAVVLQSNDVVMNNIGTHLGAAAVADESLVNAYVSQHVLVLRTTTESILPEFLAIALNSEYVQEQIVQRATGSVMPSLALSRLDEIEIPLPNLETQANIVALVRQKLDRLISATNELETAQVEFLATVNSLGSGTFE